MPLECNVCRQMFVLLYRPKVRSFPRACCVACENQLAYQARRVAPAERPCIVCGEPFTAKRSDAKTCGPACRQKALRHRRRSACASD
jgi:hypothetical protein